MRRQVLLSPGASCVEEYGAWQRQRSPVLLRAIAPMANWVRDTLHEVAPTGPVLFTGTAPAAVTTACARCGGNVVSTWTPPPVATPANTRFARVADAGQGRLLGTTDLYVHDHQGRPVLRISCPGMTRCPKWLRPIRALPSGIVEVRRPSGSTLVFDRGAFIPRGTCGTGAMKDFDFVTYDAPTVFAVSACAFSADYVTWRAHRVV